MQSPINQLTHAFCNDPVQPPLLRELVPLGESRRYRKGTVLIHESDPGDTLFVVVEGRVKVYCADDFDKEITFGVIGPGDYFGEMALDGGPRSANVVTLESTVCTLLTRKTLLGFIGHHPEFALDLLSKVIRRARLATTSARNLAFVDVYGRLSQCLQNLATLQPDGTHRITERITHQEIASRTGCSREMVSRILKDLEHGGYVQIDKRQIVLVQPLPARW